MEIKFFVYLTLLRFDKGDNVSIEKLPSICMFTVLGSKNDSLKMNISNNARYVSLCSLLSVINIWDNEKKKCYELVGHSGATTVTVFNRFHPLLLSGSIDKTSFNKNII